MGQITRKNPVRVKDRRRGGLDPFAYMGVEAISPLNTTTDDRPPTFEDYTKFDVGDWWIDRSTDPRDIWVLVRKHANVATWSQFFPSADIAAFFDADTGTAIPTAAGAVNVPGASVLTTTGNLDVLTYDMTNGTNGQVIISGGAEPIWANITSTGATITITNGPNTLNLETVGTGGFDSLTADTGVATPVLGDIDILGDANITTAGAAATLSVDLNDSISIDGLTLSALGAGVMQTNASGVVTSNNGTNGQLLIGGGSAPAWATITSDLATVTITNGANTINLESAIAVGMDTMTGDSGTATPSGGNIVIAGGSNITTAGNSLSKITIDLDDSIDIVDLTLTPLGAGVMQTNASGVVTSTAGTHGQVLVGGGSAPAWTNITSTGATITVTNGANTINLESALAVGMDTMTGDSGTATPSGGIIDLAGGTNITTSGDNLSTITIDLDDSITISGTLTLSALGAGVMQTNASGVVTSNNGTNGQLLIGGGSAPAWDNITSTGATITITNGANTIDLSASGGGLGTNAFLAFQPSQYLIGANILYTLGEDVILTEVYDTGGDFYPGDGAGSPAIYTAPSDGKYFFGYNHISFHHTPTPPPPTDPQVYNAIVTSNYVISKDGFRTLHEDHVSAAYISALSDMDMGDTAEFQSKINHLDINVDGDATEVRTFVCGYKVV